MLDRLPEECLLYLLEFFSVASLAALERTSKRWHRLLADNNFWFAYLRRSRRDLASLARYKKLVNYRALYRNNLLFTRALNGNALFPACWVRPALEADERIETIERTIPLFDDTLYAFPSVVVRNPGSADFVPFYRIHVGQLVSRRDARNQTDKEANNNDISGTLNILMSTTQEDGVRQINSHHLVLNIDKISRIMAVASWKFELSGKSSCFVEVRNLSGSFDLIQKVDFPGGVMQIQCYFRSQLPKLFEMLEITDEYFFWYFRINEDAIREQMLREDFSVPNLRDLWIYSPSKSHYQRCIFPSALQGVLDLCFVPYIFKRTMISLHCNGKRNPPTLNAWDFFNGRLLKSTPLPLTPGCPEVLDQTSHIIPREELGTWLLVSRTELPKELSATSNMDMMEFVTDPDHPLHHMDQFNGWLGLAMQLDVGQGEFNNDDGSTLEDIAGNHVMQIAPQQLLLKRRNLLITFYGFQVSSGTNIRYRATVTLPPAIATCQYESYFFALHCDGRLCVYSMEEMITHGLRQRRESTSLTRFNSGDNNDNNSTIDTMSTSTQVSAIHLDLPDNNQTTENFTQQCSNSDKPLASRVIMKISQSALSQVDEEAFMSCFRGEDGNVWLIACLGYKMLAVDFDLPCKVRRERRKEACLDDYLDA